MTSTSIFENHLTSHPTTLPPPPPRTVPLGGGRSHGVRLPALSVVPNTSIASHQSTPLSAISHQSPFSSGLGTPIVSSCATSTVTSPMNSRHSGHFNVPYDPRDWASGDIRANQAARARQQAEDGVASPPPPYSPQTSGQQQIERLSTTLPVNTDTSLQTSGSSHISSATSAQIHNSIEATRRPQPRARLSNHPAQRHSIHTNFPVPPPPPALHSQTGNPAESSTLSRFQSPSVAGDYSPGPSISAPTARRAVSANAGITSRGDSGSSTRSTSKSRWQPGMPLPGPPPGPPPATSRSQSLNNARNRSDTSSNAYNRPLRYARNDSGLGPVPPTPADWSDDSSLPQSIATSFVTGQFAPANSLTTSQAASRSNGTALSRSSALRDSSVKNLHERRAQNRNSRVISSSETHGLAIDTSSGDSTLKSGPSTAKTEPLSADTIPSGRQQAFSPSESLHVHEAATSELPMRVSIPSFVQPSATAGRETGLRSAGIPPKALPTPPLSNKAPLSARSAINSTRGSFSASTAELAEDFIRDAIHRHGEYLEQERSAHTDLERLQGFVDFIRQEWAIRQRRYASTIQSGAFDVQAAQEAIFASTAFQGTPSSSTEHSNISTYMDTPLNTTQARPESTYCKDYQPALSPIASMDYDEMSSRGRAPSRWWESQTGSYNGDQVGRIKRSKRESKYMGLSKEFLMAHSPSGDYATHDLHSFAPTNTSYPLEKRNPDTFGYYDESEPDSRLPVLSKPPATPPKLDISRFITLPPPYPRHHPAVNNSHPDLAEYRNMVRSLIDLSETRSRRTRHELSVAALRGDLQKRLSENRRLFRANIQGQIQEGSISFAEAAEAEEANKLDEFELEKKSIQAEFDTLQDVVINPLHDMLNARTEQLNAGIQRLQDDLQSEARHQDPDRPQEEGDETPELLEKLTQLKWLFDTREQIQKECFEVLSERNNSFKTVVLFPYRWNSNNDKIRDTESFFQTDTQTRYAAFCQESLQRHEEFQTVIDEQVSRGVQLQSSAFWDIAPGLLDLLQKIPENPQQLPPIQIPTNEYDENPSYHQHPEQYLYSLLSHAEKSIYQFIESQINLHCLLHEVKTGLLAMRLRAHQAQEATVGRTPHEDYIASQQGQESTLTAELKQKVSMIEEQWLESLGSQLQATRERIKLHLQYKDAWDEIAQDDA